MMQLGIVTYFDCPACGGEPIVVFDGSITGGKPAQCPTCLERSRQQVPHVTYTDTTVENKIKELKDLLRRCLPIIESDARMMADITRHAPLDPESQAVHDNTEYESEKLVREIPIALL
jgi:hypothetical protein